MTTPPDLDQNRFRTQYYEGASVTQAYVREGVGGVPILCVHGWPETKRIWWRVIEPLVRCGFEVIVPDLRGFGESSLAADGHYDVPTHSQDLLELVTEHLGHERVIVCGGDLGGPVIQDLALRHRRVVERMILFNCPLPYLPTMAGLRTRHALETSDYYVRQGTDADALSAELSSPEVRRRYIATFYTSRLWAHPGAFLDHDSAARRYESSSVVDFHTEPFADAERLRASFGPYEAVFDPTKRTAPPVLGPNPAVETLILYGSSDHVVAPDFDLLAAEVFPNHVGPFLLRDCGHFVQWEAPRPLVSAIRSFCRDLITGEGGSDTRPQSAVRPTRPR
jgi:pimeloyl-ACP methyl ester carboxylesterase